MLRISLAHALPPRARQLTNEEMQHVFGGCGRTDVACGSSKDCCDYFYCETGHCKAGIPY